MTFSEELRQRISDKYREKEFSYTDFADIARKHKLKEKTIGQALRYLEGRGLLYVVGGVDRGTGGSPTKIYRVTKGVELVILPKRTPGERNISAQEIALTQCANRLELSLNRVMQQVRA